MSERFSQILQRYLTRREAIAVAGAVLAAPLVLRSQGGRVAPGIDFEAIGPSTADGPIVAAGHRVQVLLRWGDPLFPQAPAFDHRRQTPAAQAQQFGYNCDYVGFLPLPAGSGSSSRGLLVVNHEYTNPELMFDSDPLAPTAEEAETQLQAHGLSVVEIERQANGWALVRDSKFNRRITGTTPIRLTGPAAGHAWLKTSLDPAGTQVLGTLNNCSGGKTPWGTVLSGEENFHQYFGLVGKLDLDDPRRDVHLRYGLPLGESEYLWERHIRRFDVSREPNEPFRFGWVVEIDPYDPASTPKKRTALGRFKHEAATFMTVPGRPLAVYSGDDERFECVYKFVSARAWNPNDRAGNHELLDEGTLHVARFKDDGTGEWLPLLQGRGPLTAENGFRTQADVLINTRTAAELVGGTQMDRPEDIEMNPASRKVYIVLTNNDLRGGVGRPRPDRANPRRFNRHGHILELTEDQNDPAASRFTWRVFLLCGEPLPGFDSQVTRISCPDNLTFDLSGNLWIATDGQPKSLKVNDGLFVMPTEGTDPKPLAQFFAAVRGAEVCGPEFTPDNTSLFVAIQHPGEGGTYRAPLSQWPDGQSPPRPSVVVISAEHGGRVGTKKS